MALLLKGGIPIMSGTNFPSEYVSVLPSATIPASTAGTESRVNSKFLASHRELPGFSKTVTEFSALNGKFVDQDNEVTQLTGVNWHGCESSAGVPIGLETFNAGYIVSRIVEMGATLVRFPISANIFSRAGIVNSGVNFTANPNLVNMTRGDILKNVIDRLEKAGVWVIIDVHRKSQGTGVDSDGVWYGGGFTEQNFIDAWTTIATELVSYSNVIGADLWNEPHKNAHWGNGGATADDWKRVSGLAADAVLAVAPKWLVIVEGVQHSVTGGDETHWLGGNLRDAGAAAFGYPTVSIPNKLVLSVHEYQPSLIQPRWSKYEAITSAAEFTTQFDDNWGHTMADYPILIGETGSNYFDPLDIVHTNALVNYININSLWVTYWTLTQPSTDSGAILNDNYLVETTEDKYREWLIRTALNGHKVAPSGAQAGKHVVLEFTPREDFVFNSHFAISVDASSAVPAANVWLSSDVMTTHKNGSHTIKVLAVVDAGVTGQLDIAVDFAGAGAESVYSFFL